jgi:hypothetical protein
MLACECADRMQRRSRWEDAVDLTQLMSKIDKKWGNLDGGLGEMGGRRKRLLRHGEGRSAIDAIAKDAKLTNRLRPSSQARQGQTTLTGVPKKPWVRDRLRPNFEVDVERTSVILDVDRARSLRTNRGVVIAKK